MNLHCRMIIIKRGIVREGNVRGEQNEKEGIRVTTGTETRAERKRFWLAAPE